jgi:outer membrane autotransporter protein
MLKASPKQPLDQRWSAWGSSFGGSSSTGGNAVTGSNNVTARDYGFASGVDYHFSPNTLAGFALAGSGTNWGLAQGLGGGRSDAFQAGVYGKTTWGSVYLAGALAYTENWFTTNRLALGDQLTAKFNGQSFGGRLESGYRFIVPSKAGRWEISPYVAVQAQSFHTASYGETDLSGGGLGLNFNAMNATDTRSELGTRFADTTAIGGMPMILRAKLAWAHDWVDNPALNAAFQTLPGSSFVVNGAPIPSDSALVSAGAELRINARWSAIAKFDGEFARNSQTYAGTGTLRYTW